MSTQSATMTVLAGQTRYDVSVETGAPFGVKLVASAPEASLTPAEARQLAVVLLAVADDEEQCREESWT